MKRQIIDYLKGLKNKSIPLIDLKENYDVSSFLERTNNDMDAVKLRMIHSSLLKQEEKHKIIRNLNYYTSLEKDLFKAMYPDFPYTLFANDSVPDNKLKEFFETINTMHTNLKTDSSKLINSDIDYENLKKNMVIEYSKNKNINPDLFFSMFNLKKHGYEVFKYLPLTMIEDYVKSDKKNLDLELLEKEFRDYQGIDSKNLEHYKKVLNKINGGHIYESFLDKNIVKLDSHEIYDIISFKNDNLKDVVREDKLPKLFLDEEIDNLKNDSDANRDNIKIILLRTQNVNIAKKIVDVALSLDNESGNKLLVDFIKSNNLKNNEEKEQLLQKIYDSNKIDKMFFFKSKELPKAIAFDIFSLYENELGKIFANNGNLKCFNLPEFCLNKLVSNSFVDSYEGRQFLIRNKNINEEILTSISNIIQDEYKLYFIEDLFEFRKDLSKYEILLNDLISNLNDKDLLKLLAREYYILFNDSINEKNKDRIRQMSSDQFINSNLNVSYILNESNPFSENINQLIALKSIGGIKIIDSLMLNVFMDEKTFLSHTDNIDIFKNLNINLKTIIDILAKEESLKLENNFTYDKAAEKIVLQNKYDILKRTGVDEFIFKIINREEDKHEISDIIKHSPENIKSNLLSKKSLFFLHSFVEKVENLDNEYNLAHLKELHSNIKDFDLLSLLKSKFDVVNTQYIKFLVEYKNIESIELCKFIIQNYYFLLDESEKAVLIHNFKNDEDIIAMINKKHMDSLLLKDNIAEMEEMEF